jgi:hypothetical protein
MLIEKIITKSQIIIIPDAIVIRLAEIIIIKSKIVIIPEAIIIIPGKKIIIKCQNIIIPVPKITIPDREVCVRNPYGLISFLLHQMLTFVSMTIVVSIFFILPIRCYPDPDSYRDAEGCT